MTENNTWKLTTVCLPYVKSLTKTIQKVQDNIQQWIDSLKISLLSQASNRIQHDQELCVLYLMLLW